MSAEPTTTTAEPTPPPAPPTAAAPHADDGISRLLFRAVRDNQTEVAKYMLDAHMGMDTGDTETGRTLLHAAVDANAIDTMHMLLDAGYTGNGLEVSVVLRFAIRNKSVAVVNMLLPHAPTDTVNDYTLLHQAVKTGQVDIARKLIEYGADVNRADVVGRVPLYYAVCSKSFPMIELLLEREADTINIDATSWTRECKRLLLPAVRGNHFRAFVFLLRASNLDLATDDCGLLNLAASLDLVMIMTVLIAAGANVNNTAGVNGETPLMAAIRARAGFAKAYLYLRRADPNIKNQDGDTALHLATMSNQACSIKSLLAHGARINEKTGSGETALFLAVRHRHFESLDVLLARGASVHLANADGISPILLALTSSYPTPENIIKALLHHGATSDIYTMLASVPDDDLRDRLMARFSISSLQIATRHQLQQQKLAESRKRAREADDDEVIVVSSTLMCKICLEKDIAVTLAPCGHRGLCEECVEHVIGGPCPFCRKDVLTFIEKEFTV